jgi:hypothetical protein
MNASPLRGTLALAVLAASSLAAAGEITLYEHDNFGGRTFHAVDVIENLANSGFNDIASSVVVRSGTWQVCDDAYFRGHCVTLRPGSYPSLGQMGLNDRVSSARDLSAWGAPPGPSQGGASGWGNGARAVLYSNPGFQGDSYVIESDYLPDLANTGFNDRAQSLRVEGGYWIFCSDAAFRGTCRTFGPGSYPNLDWALDNRISSGRRISGQYPYSGNPQWR